MEVVQRAREELLVYAMVPTRRQVVVLAVPRFFLVQNANQEVVDRMQEVLNQGMILCRLNNFCVDRLREMHVEHLLPVGLVAAEEHIAELSKACDIVQVQFFWRADELGDHLVNGKLDPKQAIILVDFDLVLVMWIVALQLVNFGEHCLSVPTALKYEKKFFSYILVIVSVVSDDRRIASRVIYFPLCWGRAVITVRYHAREKQHNNVREKVKRGKMKV
jgi:hypothetical protein